MQAYDLTQLSILVLEKHLLIRKLLTDVFSEFGVPTVQSTGDPQIAWDMFRRSPSTSSSAIGPKAWTAWRF